MKAITLDYDFFIFQVSDRSRFPIPQPVPFMHKEEDTSFCERYVLKRFLSAALDAEGDLDHSVF